MSDAPETLEGWYALHDFRSINWKAWRRLAPEDRRAIVDEAVGFFEDAERVTDSDEGASALYSVLGHKGDVMTLHLRPTPGELRGLELAFQKTRLSDYTTPTTSYVGVTELGTYVAKGLIKAAAAEASGEPKDADMRDPMDNPFVKRRLKPDIPDTSHVCFYPMDKRRGEVDNWYDLPMERRRELMKGHGMIGRKYADRVTQMITGSVGLDDWEWGVTLFADDPLAFKKLVYEMRFDGASSRYALFGSFYIGLRLQPVALRDLLAVGE